MTNPISEDNYPAIHRLWVHDFELYRTKGGGFLLAADDTYYSVKLTKHQLKELGAELIKIADDDSVELDIADWIVEETGWDKLAANKTK